MKKIYATFDSNGYPTGFWHDDIHRPNDIPQAALEITEEQWQQLLDQSTGRRRFVAGAVVEATPIPAIPAPIQAISKLERANPITHRALRELILTLGEAYPAGKNTVFYQRVLATEEAIQAERAKL